MFRSIARNALLSTSVAALSIMAGQAFASSSYDTEIVDSSLNVDTGSAYLGLHVLMDNGTIVFVDPVTLSPLDITLDGAGGVFDTNSNDAVLNTNLIGTSGFEKVGDGVLTLKGMNSFSGPTTISQGTLALSGQGRINQSSVVTVSSGATLDVSDAVSASVKTLAGAGSIVLGNTSLSVDNGSFSGIISGNGGISVGGGTLTLTGNNTFTGQAASGGTGVLKIGDGGLSGSVAGNILNSGSLVFDRSGLLSYAGTITGNGDITFTGGGIFVLENSSSASGAVTIDTGTTVQWGMGGAAGWLGAGSLGISVGPMTNNGSLIVNRSSDRIYQGAINGTGSLTKLGTGMLALSNTSGYTGATEVKGGTLLVSGSIGSSSLTTVRAGTLTGTGTVGATEVLNGAFLSPGNLAAVVSGAHVEVSSIGTLNVNGSLNFASGSTLNIKVDDQGNSDKVSVTGPTSIDPTAKVHVGPFNGTDDGTTYAPDTSYTIVSSSSGVSGHFDSAVDEQFAFLDASLAYTGNDVLLKLSRNDVAIPDVANTSNQAGAASALNGFDPSDPAYQQLMGLTPEQAQQAYDDISGEVHATGQQVLDQTFGLFTSSLVGGMTGQAGTGRQTALLGYVEVPTNSVPGLAAIESADRTATISSTAWITPLAGVGTVKGDGNASRINWGAGGLALGYDGAIEAGDQKISYGAGIGYLASKGEVASRSSNYDSQGGFVGVHGGWTDGKFAVSGDVAYGLNSISTSRDIHVGAITRTATADYWAQTLGGGIEASYGFALSDQMTLRPVGRVDVSWTGHDGATETGAGSLNASIDEASYWQVDTGVGLEIENKSTLSDGSELTMRARALWQHATADTTPSQDVALAGNSGAQFAVGGASSDRDRLVVGAGVDYDPAGNAKFSLNYAGTFSNAQATHVLGASFGFEF